MSNFEDNRTAAQKILEDARNPYKATSSVSQYRKQAEQNLAVEQKRLADESAARQQARQDEVAQLEIAQQQKRDGDSDGLVTTGLSTTGTEATRKHATVGDVVQDSAVAVAQGFSGAYEAITTGLTAASYGLSKAEAAAFGTKFDQTFQEALDEQDKIVGVTKLQNLLNGYVTEVTQNKRAEMQAIENDTSLSEKQRGVAIAKYYAANPELAMYALATSAVKSGTEMLLTGGVGKAVNLGVKGTVGLSSFGSGFAGQIDNEQAQGLANDETYLRAGGVGGATALFTSVSGVLAKSDFDAIGANAALGKQMANPGSFGRAAVDTGLEGTEEVLTAGVETLAINDAKGSENPWDGIGAASAHAAVLGVGQGTVGAVKGGAGKAVDAAVNTVNEKLDGRADKKNGTLEENLDPKSAKYNPTRAFKTALYQRGSTDANERAQASEVIAQSTRDVANETERLMLAIEDADSQASKDKAQKAFDTYNEKVVAPLNAEVALYKDHIENSKESILSSITDFSTNNGDLVNNYIAQAEANSKAAKEKAEINSPAVTTTANTTTGTATSYKATPVEGSQVKATARGSLDKLIQSGESASMGYDAVNYSGDKASSTENLANLTAGEIVSRQKSGDVLAVGKYQFHESSFPEAVSKLDWLTNDTKMTPEVQDRIYAEYYVGRKRPALANYIRGKSNDLNAAHDDMASEWAAAQAPNGKGKYGGNNHASIKAADIQEQLQASRALYKEAIDAGKSDAEAMSIAALGGNGQATSSAPSQGNMGAVEIPKGHNLRKASNYATENAATASTGYCAKYVRKALQKNGIKVTGQTHAFQYHSNRDKNGKNTLENNGFKKVDNTGSYQVGDVMVTDAIGTHKSGHIAIWNGKNWVSDFVQDNKDGTVWSDVKVTKDMQHVYRDTNFLNTSNAPVTGGSAETTTSSPNMEMPSVETELPTDTKVATAETPVKESKFVEPKDDTPETAFIKAKINETRTLFSTMSEEEIEAHPLLTTEQKQSLRQLTEYKRQLASTRDSNKVSQDVLDGHKGDTANKSHIGLRQYDEIFTKAIAMNDVDTVNQHLGYLQRFNNNQQSKNEAIQDVLSQQKSNAANPVWVAPDEKGKWRELTPAQVAEYGTKELSMSGAFEVTTANRGTQGVTRDAQRTQEAVTRWTEGTESIMEGVIPIVAQTRGSRKYTATTEGVTTEVSTTPSTTPSGKSNTSSVNSDTGKTTDPTKVTPQKAKFNSINRAASAEDAVVTSNENAVYIGRSGFGKDTKSISQVNPKTGEGVGNPGWLGDATGRKGASAEQKLATYNDTFKKHFAATPGFAEGVLDLKNKELYINNNASQKSEAGYITDLMEVIPDDVDAAKSFVDRIISYSPETGFQLQMQTHKQGDKATKGVKHLDDTSFGFSDTNQFDLTAINDERYEENKLAIDKAIDGILDVQESDDLQLSYPEQGLGFELKTAAPRTLAYFNKQTKKRLNINNGELLAARPEVVPRADMGTMQPKKKNVIPSKGTKDKERSTVAPTIKAKGVRSEISEQTTQTLTDYNNSYSTTDKNGDKRTVTIERNKKDNTVKKFGITNHTTGKYHDQTNELADKTVSDELILKSFETKLNKGGAETSKFEQDGRDSTIKAETTESDGRIVPKEVLNKSHKLEDVIEKYEGGIEEGVNDKGITALYNTILKAVTNYNPKLKVSVKSGRGDNGYDAKTDSITVHTGEATEHSLHQEVSRIAIHNAVTALANKEYTPENDEDGTHLGRQEILYNDLDKLKRKVQQAINAELGIFKNLPLKTRMKIVNAMDDNASFLSASTTDIDMINFLKQIPMSDTRKIKSNVFKRMVATLATFFNLGNSKEVKTAFTSALEITARMVTENATDTSVNFKPDDAAKLKLFQGTDEQVAERAEAEGKKEYFQRNQLLAKFIQKATRDKPLTQVTNFTSKLKLDMMQGLGKYTKAPPTKAQREQVANFLAFRDDLAVHLRETFKAHGRGYETEGKGADKKFVLDDDGNKILTREYDYQDLKGFLVSEQNPELDENTLTALALAAYDWSIEFGNKTFNREEDLRKLMNLEPDDKGFVPKGVKEQYLHIGRVKSYSAMSLGKLAADALGLKDTDKASAESLSSLQASLGEWAISAMQAADLIHIHTMKTEQHKANIIASKGDVSGLEAVNEKGVVSFVSITNLEGSDINGRLDEVVKASRSTQGYLGKVFGTDIGLRAPLLEKPSDVKTKIKRTLSRMSPKQQGLVKIMQDEPMSINTDMLNSLQMLLAVDREATLNMIGAMVTDEELAAEHIDDRSSKMSAAEGVLRDLENGLDFIDSLEKLDDGQLQEFYDTVYAAKNNRMHYNSNMFNLQSSKVQRSLGEYSNFKNDIDMSGVTADGIDMIDSKGKISGATTFLRGVAESAEGTEDIIKAKLIAKGVDVSEGYTVDKLGSEVFIEPFYEYLREDADVARAMVGTRKMLKGESPSKADVAAIQKVVKFWEADANSLRALVEYTKFADSVANNDATFTTSLGLGSDGINNGSAISYVQLGVASAKFLAQVGMLPLKSGFNNYFETRNDKSVGDYYTGFKQDVVDALAPNDDPKRTKTIDTIMLLNTSLFGRKSFKAVLIPFGYSAGYPRLKQLLFGQFMEDIKKQMKTLAKLDPESVEAKNLHQKLEGALNALLPNDKQVALPQGKDLLEFSIPFEMSLALNKIYEETVGESVIEALKSYAGPFIDARDTNIKIQGAAYETYDALKRLVEAREDAKYMQHLLDSVPSYKDKTDEQIKEIFKAEGIPQDYYDANHKVHLDAIRPGVKTPFNQAEEGSTKETDFRITKESSELAADDFSSSTNWKVFEDAYVGSSTKLPKRTSTEEDVGVMVNSAQVQGTDGLIAAVASALGGKVNINVHDAAIGGILNHVAMTLMQNKATFEALRDYHAQSASLLALSEAIKSIVDMRKEGLLDIETQDNMVFDAIEGVRGKDSIKDFIKEQKLPFKIDDVGSPEFFNQVLEPMLVSIMMQTRDTEAAKFQILEEMGVMHQYGGEGGEYVITRDDKAGIAKQRGVVNEIHKQIEKNIDTLSEEFEYVDADLDAIEDRIPNIPKKAVNKFTRNSAAKDSKSLYIFTDNTERSSGANTIDTNSPYYTTYIKPFSTKGNNFRHTYPGATQAVVRGLPNAMPISTKVSVGQQFEDTEESFNTFKQVIDMEIDYIVQAVESGKFTAVKFSSQGHIGRNGGKAKLPMKHYEYLTSKLREIGIDNTKRVHETSSGDKGEVAKFEHKQGSKNVSTAPLDRFVTNILSGFKGDATELNKSITAINNLVSTIITATMDGDIKVKFDIDELNPMDAPMFGAGVSVDNKGNITVTIDEEPYHTGDTLADIKRLEAELKEAVGDIRDTVNKQKPHWDVEVGSQLSTEDAFNRMRKPDGKDADTEAKVKDIISTLESNNIKVDFVEGGPESPEIGVLYRPKPNRIEIDVPYHSRPAQNLDSVLDQLKLVIELEGWDVTSKPKNIRFGISKDKLKTITDFIKGVDARDDMEVAPHRMEVIDYLMSRLKTHKRVGHDVTVVTVESIISDGKERNASYNPDTGVISLSAKAINAMSLDKQIEVVTHEMWHAATHITRTTSTNKNVRLADAELTKMRKQLLKKFPKGSFMHDTVLANNDEFVAYGMTDPAISSEIANNLKGSYKAPGKKIASSFLAFIKAVSQLFTGVQANSPEGQHNFEQFAKLADVLTRQPTKDEVISFRESTSEVLHSTQRPSERLKNLQATNVSTEHNNHLNQVIDGSINDFMGTDAQHTQQVNDIADAPDLRAIQAGFRMSDKELRVMEIMKVITRDFLDNKSGTKTASELRANYKAVMSKLTRNHFLDDPANATRAEIKAAQKKLDYFKKHDNLNSAEHVERYVSMAMASQEFRAIVDTISNSREKTKGANDNWLDKLMTWFTNTMQHLTNRQFSTKGLNSSQEVDALVKRLNIITQREARATANILDVAYSSATSVVTVPANFMVSKLTAAVFGTFSVANSFAPNSALGRLAGTAHKIYRTGGVLPHLDKVGDVVAKQNARKVDGSGRLGGIGELIVEASRNVGMKATVGQLIQMTNKASQDRATVATTATKALGKLFNNVEDVPKEQLDSITQVALRTDMSSLLNNGVNILRVLKLLRNPQARNEEIARLEGAVKRLSPEFNDILHQTKTLALYMAKEETGAHLVKNAESIAMGLGSWYESDMDSVDPRLLATIDQLASLYAVNMTTAKQQAALTELINSEPEAVKGMLNHHLEMTVRGKENFRNNPLNYSKGYMPQKTHNLRSLKFAEDAHEIRKLRAQGWQIIGEDDMGQDLSDRTDQRTLMFHNDMLYKDYVSGALDMKDTHAKGTQVYGLSQPGDMARIAKERMIARRTRNRTPHSKFNVAKQESNNMIATYDTEGNIINYHYEMTGRVRDTYLERDNNALELMGMYHSNLSAKPQIAETQRNVAKELHADYLQSWAKDPELFVTLDPESTDPEVVKMWRMMPYEFRAEAEALFGKGKPIVVRSTAFNSVFGFHTYSMAEMFDKLGVEKNHLEKLITTVMTAIFGEEAQMRVLQGERLIQKGVAQMKDFIVIRNAKVLIGNVVANSLLLTLQGVPPSQQIKDFISVWRNGGQYRKLAGRIAEIDSEIAINKNRPTVLRDLKRERNEAMQEMQDNPLHNFMEQGLMSSIVEDTAMYKDDEGFKSELDKKIDNFKGNFPEQVITATEWVMTSPGTPLHNFLAHSTQFSDLAAKYSLTTHRMNEGDDMRTAIAEAQGAFINYDIPTGKGMDYMNKMGLFMFTKFAVRFQQVMIGLLTKNAGSVLSQHMLVEHMTDMPGVLDPLFTNKFGNPLETSVMGYDDAVGGISTVNAISSIF